MQPNSTPPTTEELARLARSEQRYRRLFEAARDGILLLDIDTGRITDANPFVYELLGYPAGALLGLELWEIGLFGDRAVSQAAFRQLHDRGYIRYESLPLETKQGERRDVEFVSNVYPEGDARVIQCNIRDITERKRAEAALRASERVAQSTLDGLSAEVTILDQDGNVLAINEAWRRFGEENKPAAFNESNLPAELNVAEGANYLVVCDAAKGDDEVDAHLAAAGIRAVAAGHQDLFTMEYACHSPQERRWFTLRATPFPGDGPARVVVSHENVTARKRAERALAASEERLSLILSNIEDIVFLLRVEPQNGYRFLFVNPAFLQLSGLSEEQVVGSRVEDVFPLATHALILDKYAEAIRDRRAVRWQEAFSYPAGERTGDARAVPLFDEQGRCSHLIGTLHDITEQKRLQGQMIRSERLAAMGELVSGVAHEINNPLAAISGQAQLLQMHPDPQVQEDGRAIKRMTDRATRIVRALLTFARQAHAADRLPTPLRPLIEETLEIVRYNLRKGDVELALDLAQPDVSPVINAGQIEQVLLNLLNNAEHALRQREGDKQITITTSRTVRKNREWAVLTVSDNGPGIPKNLKDRVFDPFFTTKPQGEGTGLGLSICHGIVAEHGGGLEVSSRPGVGATFTLTLPLTPAPEEEVTPGAAAASGGDSDAI